MVPEEGVEPTRPCGQRILSPPRLPFRHSGLPPKAQSALGTHQDQLVRAESLRQVSMPGTKRSSNMGDGTGCRQFKWRRLCENIQNFAACV